MFHLMVPWRKRTLETERANPLRLLHEEAERLFNPFVEGWLAPVGELWRPAWSFDVEETEKEVVYRAELPGFEVPELDVGVTGEVLTIRAEHSEEAKGKERNGPTARRRVERTVTLPAGTSPERVTATYRNGLLEIHVPRVPEAKPHRIEVKT
jgi:HSP20 family protein